jgi:hypothetical protein
MDKPVQKHMKAEQSELEVQMENRFYSEDNLSKHNGWEICFLILSIQYFHHALGSAACANWLLSKTGTFSECPGNPRFELQISNIPYG